MWTQSPFPIPRTIRVWFDHWQIDSHLADDGVSRVYSVLRLPDVVESSVPDHPENEKRSRPARGHSQPAQAIIRRCRVGEGPPRPLNGSYVFNFSKRLRVSRGEQRGDEDGSSRYLVSLHTHAAITGYRRRTRRHLSLWGRLSTGWAGLPHLTTAVDACRPEPSAERVDEILHSMASLSDNRWMMSTFFTSPAILL